MRRRSRRRKLVFGHQVILRLLCVEIAVSLAAVIGLLRMSTARRDEEIGLLFGSRGDRL